MSGAAISNGRAALWASGQVAVQLYRDIPSLLLLFYMTQVLRINPAVAGASIFLPKLIWSSCCDFVVGTLSDKFRDRLPRRYFLLAGAVLLPITLIGLFWPVEIAEEDGRIRHVVLCFIAYVTVFSLFSVPHLCIGTEMTADPAGKSRLMAWRTAFIGFGVLISAGGAPWLIQQQGANANAYLVMAIVMSAISSAALLLSFLGSKTAGPVVVEEKQGAGRWAALRRNRPFRYMLGAFIVQMIGQGAAVATLTYLVVFKLAMPQPFNALALSMVVTCHANGAVQPLMVKPTKKFGTRPVYAVSSLLYSFALLIMALSPKGSLAMFLIGSVALGVTNGTVWLALFTHLSQVVGLSEEGDDDSAHAGFFTSLFVAGDKIAFALGGTLIAGVLLNAVGFQTGASVQSAGAISGIAWIFAGMPFIGNIVAAILMMQSKHKTAVAGPTPAVAAA
jgi:GPH family glycoside/pentoside/hexuronide:cation symporter